MNGTKQVNPAALENSSAVSRAADLQCQAKDIFVRQLPEWPPKDEVVGFFNQHMVPIFFTFKKEEKRHSGIITAFVLSILDEWFLVTAGHCIEQIEDNVKKIWLYYRKVSINRFCRVGSKISSPYSI